MRITCIRCGVAANRCGGHAIYCMPCALAPKPRIAPAWRRRPQSLKARRDAEGNTICADCAVPVSNICGGKRRRPPMRCRACDTKRSTAMHAIQGPAVAAVAVAVREGRLPRPATLTCADCGKPATCYDHRDYTKPLQVEAVCRSCNNVRGAADVWAAAERSPEGAAAVPTTETARA